MELKDLGLQKLKLNINDNIIETVFAKEGDHKSRGLDIQVLKNNVVTDTTGVEVEFYAKPKDGEVYLVLAKEKDLKRGKYEIIYPTHILQPGPVKVEIKLVKGEQVISTKKFILEVENAISTDDIVEKSDYRPLLAILVEAAKNEKARIEAENKRVVAEGKRVETENQREKNESQRKSAESQRKKNEEERRSNEVQRQSNESTRQAQENKRNEAENARKSSEESCKAVENTRQSNESKRVAAENERVKNEDARKANENTRIANEKKREENRKIIERWIANPSQFNGKDLEFHWNGTKLGVRLKGDTEYQYVELKGEKGDLGDVGNLTAEQVIKALNYAPASEKEFAIVKTDVHRLGDDIYEVENLVFKQGDVLNEHTRNTTGNPHNVDKSQVGLSAVDNVKQATKEEFNNHKNGPFHIVESEENANGNYIKFADGTMECYVSALTLKRTDNSNYRDAFWVFPATFVENPAVFMSHRTPFISPFVRDIPPLRTVSNTTTKTRIIQNAPTGKVFASEEYFTVSAMAKGRWK